MDVLAPPLKKDITIVAYTYLDVPLEVRING